MGPNFSGMRGLIFVLMSNVCYLAVILMFLVVTWWLPSVYCLLRGGYRWLPVVTARYRSLLLVLTFSMNEHKTIKKLLDYWTIGLKNY